MLDNQASGKPQEWRCMNIKHQWNGGREKRRTCASATLYTKKVILITLGLNLGLQNEKLGHRRVACTHTKKKKKPPKHLHTNLFVPLFGIPSLLLVQIALAHLFLQFHQQILVMYFDVVVKAETNLKIN
jgi:hypothetical protein